MGTKGYGIDEQRLADYAQQIRNIAATGVQVAIVIGGGNIFRGLSGSQKGFDRVKGDQMGMLATVINSLALCSASHGQRQFPTRAASRRKTNKPITTHHLQGDGSKVRPLKI